ncbi:phosphohydrolase, partial [Vibrio cholerae]
MVMAVVFEFSGMRCQPLRRALAVYDEQGSNVVENYETQFVTFIESEMEQDLAHD